MSSNDTELARALAASLEPTVSEEEQAQLAMALSASSAQPSSANGMPVDVSEEEQAQLAMALSASAALHSSSRHEQQQVESDNALSLALEISLAESSSPRPTVVPREELLSSHPPFTAVPPEVVRGISLEHEYAAASNEQPVAMGLPVDVADADPFPSTAEPQPPPVRQQTSGEVRALVAELEREEEAARRSHELGPTFECGICLEDAVPLLAGHRLSCGHTFCVPCIGEHIKVKVAGRDVSSEALTCPSCTVPIKVADVHALTWRCGDDQTWHKFELAADEAMIESLVRDGGCRRCPSATCNYAFVWQTGDRPDFECPSCAARFCLECRCVGGGVGPAHPGYTCEEYEEKLRQDEVERNKFDEWRQENARADERFRELLRRELRSGNTKPCPRCKQAITKNGGCHHHVCTSCKVKFCWNCGGFNALRPGNATCSTTCSKPARTWWTEADLGLSDPPGGGRSPSSSSDGLVGGLQRILQRLSGAGPSGSAPVRAAS